ncbi:MAG: hypothetical protein E7264_07065 [Lachnospiraceae bacterium]|nr:hypothetical protein [Lachnospiraceae bacterium]
MNFFIYKDALSTDEGFDLFGVCHWTWIIGIGIFSWWLGRFFSILGEKDVKKWKTVLGIILPLMELSRILILILFGNLNPGELPFHLCNMALFLASVYLLTDNRFVGVVYVSLCVPAAVLAVIFPGWLRYPVWSYMHIHNFLYHGLLVAVGYVLIVSRELIPKWIELWKPLLFGLIGYVVMYIINNKLMTNFWFIAQPSYQSPLAFLYEFFGDKWYLFGHFLFCSMVVLIWCALMKAVTNEK